MIELMFVLAIATAITALLMPVFAVVRESAQRVICASNERQIGMAMIMYSDANRDLLPPSAWGQDPNFRQRDMMASHRGGDPMNWEGIGVLFHQHYCNAECFYCPSHAGRHTFDRYEQFYATQYSPNMVFTNYQYAGDRDRGALLSVVAAGGTTAAVPPPKRLLLDAATALLTDGMRTMRDFNHTVGMNVLRGDGSVRWRDDNNEIYPLLPAEETVTVDTDNLYTNIWQIIIADE